VSVRTIVRGKNLEIPASVKRYAESKIGRLERLLDDRTDALVELSTESHRRPDKRQIVEVTLVIDGRTLRGESSAPSHRAAIDDVIDKLERRTVSHKRRPLLRRRGAASKTVAANDGTMPLGDQDDDRAPRIVKTKRFAIEPMFEEDAVSRMEELGHDFFIFVNAESERVAVLYRRDDGDYGLIEPAVGGTYAPAGAQRRDEAAAG
jgi:putative sigma-54 modulation protein